MKTKTIALFALLFALLFVAGTTQSYAQEETDSIPSGGGYEKASVYLTNGDTLDTYVYINYNYPHLYQSKVMTINEDTYTKYQEGEKIKKEIESYQASAVNGYKLDSGKEFKNVRYANLMSDKKEEKIAQQYLLEVLADGDITVYRRGYRSGNGFIRKPVSDAKFEGGEVFTNFMNGNFELVVQKGETIKNIRNYNLKKLVGDKKAVLMNYAKGTYGFKNEFVKQPAFGANCNIPYRDGLLAMVNDYNSKPLDPVDEDGGKKKKKKKKKKDKKKKK